LKKRSFERNLKMKEILDENFKGFGSYVVVKATSSSEIFNSGIVIKSKYFKKGSKAIFLKKDTVDSFSMNNELYHIVTYYHIIAAEIKEDSIKEKIEIKPDAFTGVQL